MNDNCTIAKPIDVIATTEGEICIWPWFDMHGQNPKLDRLWREYRDTRIKCGIPDEQSAFVERIYPHSDFTIDDLMNCCRNIGEPLKKWWGKEPGGTIDRMPGGEVNDPSNEIERRLKPFGIARMALIKAVEKHLYS